MRSESIQAVDYRKDACPNRYLLAFQAAGIPGSIPFFMVAKDNRYDRIRKSHLLKNLRPNNGMDFHPVEFLWCQFSWFRNDVFRHREFANVMQKRRGLQRLHFVAR